MTRLAAAFARSRYVAGEVEARAGRRCAALDRWLASIGAPEAVFLTAWNPGGRRRPAGWNRRRQAALDARLRRWPSRAAWSGLRRWREEMRLVAMPRRRAMVLARRFGQAAVFSARRGAPARLLWCGAGGVPC